MTLSETAVVFSAKDNYYGCLYRKGKVRKLPVECCFPERFALSGRYVAYTYRGSAVGDEVDRIGVYDLKNGRSRKLSAGVGEANDLHTGEIIFAFFVRANGTIAWLQSTWREDEEDHTGPPEVHVIGPDGERRVLDAGNIADGSLGLSSDRRTLYWTKDGTARFAVLP